MTKFSVKDKVYRSSIFDKYSYVSGTCACTDRGIVSSTQDVEPLRNSIKHRASERDWYLLYFNTDTYILLGVIWPVK